MTTKTKKETKDKGPLFIRSFDPDLRRRFKAACAMKGVTMGFELERLVTKYLGEKT